MITKTLIKADLEVKPTQFAGIDVGAEELILILRKNGKPFNPQKFTNTPADRARLVNRLVKLPAGTYRLYSSHRRLPLRFGDRPA